MQLSDLPARIRTAFATSGAKNTIPETTATPGAAAYDVGFPALTMLPLTAGGVPPSGQDFNGVFNAITLIQRWQSAGGFFPFDSAWATANSGYPKGALLLRAAGTGFWFNTTNANSNNPDTGGAGWVPFGADWTNGVDTGAANACVVDYTPTVTALVDGAVFWFKAAANNTGAATLNVNGLGVKTIVGGAHAALQGGEIGANGRCLVVWSAGLNAFILVGCTGAAIQVANATQTRQAVALGQFVSSKTANGYVTLPNGIILQWGSVSIPTSTGITWTFPIAFPNACFSAQASLGTGGSSEIVCATGLSTTSASIDSSPGAVVVTCNLLAIGH